MDPENKVGSCLKTVQCHGSRGVHAEPHTTPESQAATVRCHFESPAPIELHSVPRGQQPPHLHITGPPLTSPAYRDRCNWLMPPGQKCKPLAATPLPQAAKPWHIFTCPKDALPYPWDPQQAAATGAKAQAKHAIPTIYLRLEPLKATSPSLV